MKILIDTNILLDIALKRIPFYEDSVSIIKKIENNKIVGYISATTITDIYYITKKQKNHTIAIEFISNLIEIFEVIGINKDIIKESIESEILDFEDAIQAMSSFSMDLDYIITRNQKDFINSPVKALTPHEMLNLLKKKNK